MRKQAIETAAIPAVIRAGKFAGLVAPALPKPGVKIRGLAPNAKHGDIVRKSGPADLRRRDSHPNCLKGSGPNAPIQRDEVPEDLAGTTF
jgi:hypothetical protein